MQDVLSLLLRRQARGELTTFGKLALSSGQPVRNAIARLREAVDQKEVRIGYWDDWTATGKVYAFPSVQIASKMMESIDSIVWPKLTNALITSEMAARIYVWNAMNPVNLDDYPRRSTLWHSQIVPAYAALAKRTFNRNKNWLLEQGLFDKLPLYGENIVIRPKIVKRGSNTKVSNSVCRICCKTMMEPPEQLRGIHTKCLEELAIRTGSNVDYFLKLAIITNEQLDEMMDGIRDLRPTYTTEEAEQIYPEGYIELPELLEKAERRGITRERILWAVGGPRGFSRPLNHTFAQFYIGAKQYVSKNTLRDLYQVIEKEEEVEE